VKTNPWLGIWFDSLALSLDIQAVVALRVLKIARGGASGRAEARRTVTEKIAAASALQALAVTGRLGTAPAQATARVVAHYAPKVRANRKRLAR
jgi:hypothetical protein